MSPTTKELAGELDRWISENGDKTVKEWAEHADTLVLPHAPKRMIIKCSLHCGEFKKNAWIAGTTWKNNHPTATSEESNDNTRKICELYGVYDLVF